MQSSRAALVSDINRIRTDQNVRLEVLGHGPTLEQQRSMALMGRQHRELFQDLELNLPQPSATDRPGDYQVALLSKLQRFSPTFRDSDLRRLAASGGLARGIEAAIVQDAQNVAADKTQGSFRKPGALREIRRVDQAGHATTEFHGSPLSWMGAFMSPVVTCVEAFVNPATGRRIVR
jgi:hypothetical protein